MMNALRLATLVAVLGALALSAWAADGTQEGACPGSVAGKPEVTVRQTDDTYNLAPLESVSLSQTQAWRDNRLRAYYSTSLYGVNGFLLFDVSAIPDDAVITSMTLRCYLELAYGSPASNPVVDVYYSADDNWTRAAVAPGALSLDVLLQDNVPFTSYTPYYDFQLNVSAHNWTGDLLDNQICLALKDDVTYYSYVYFFGSGGGTPVGTPPQLTIVTQAGGPQNVQVTLTPIGYPFVIPPGGGTFSFDATVQNLQGSPVTVNAWIGQWTPAGAWQGPLLGPLTIVMPTGASVTRNRLQNVPGTAASGLYTYVGYVGLYGAAPTIWDSSSFTYTKQIGDGETSVGDWACTGELFPGESGGTSSVASLPEEFTLSASPNPFNPVTAIGYRLSAPGLVTLRVYDTAGREVAALVDGWREAGSHQVTFDASGLPSGIYFARLTAGTFTQIQKLVLLK
ncbi:MAG: T9SS C-terminal target domain-containing protein [Candidatus Zixiibacteriota bacterium]|nr:MAG: T9SS C-terminal target domain-containing protein [candidate division Zixibacteria bacterium]